MFMTVVLSVVASYLMSIALSDVRVYVTLAVTLPGKLLSPSADFIVSTIVLSFV